MNRHETHVRVYYLTAAQFAISNIVFQRIKISRYTDLNDPFELLGVNLIDKKYRQAFKKMRDEINRSKGIICFSRSWKNPLIWGHYAEKHTGIALGFDIPDSLLLPVLYEEGLAPIQIDPKTGRPSEELTDRLLRIKFRDWKYEDEVRLVRRLDDNLKESGMYFEPFSEELQLREVILGHNCNLPIKGVRKLVDDDSARVKVIKARIAQGSFAVVINTRATYAK